MTDETIFAVALEKPDAAARSAYLDLACADDPEQRKRVEGLLAALEAAGGFLEKPAVGSTDPDAAPTRAFHAPGDGPTRTQGEEGEDTEDALGFLAPAQRPDSLGRIAHYEVLEVLGRGAFGIVYRAFDEKLQRVVAVKVLSPSLAATSPARKRFTREARSAALIQHENVVRVHDVSRDDEPLPYLVMEFISGETLQDRLDRTGPLEVTEALQIARQIAEGLAAAHAKGLIHRDIKPSNILIDTGSQQVKITDFGLARAADDASLTRSGTVAGTPMYMAPEQAKGETLDHRADLFSLGSVLYAILTGRPPFRAETTLAVLKRVAEDTPRPMREVIPEIPEWLCRIVEKLHAKNPAERFQTAKEVADLLGQHLAHLQQPTVVPMPQPVSLPAEQWLTGVGRPQPWRVAIYCGGILVVSIALFVLWAKGKMDWVRFPGLVPSLAVGGILAVLFIVWFWRLQWVEYYKLGLHKKNGPPAAPPRHMGRKWKWAALALVLVAPLIVNAVAPKFWPATLRYLFRKPDSTVSMMWRESEGSPVTIHLQSPSGDVRVMAGPTAEVQAVEVGSRPGGDGVPPARIFHANLKVPSGHFTIRAFEDGVQFYELAILAEEENNYEFLIPDPPSLRNSPESIERAKLKGEWFVRFAELGEKRTAVNEFETMEIRFGDGDFELRGSSLPRGQATGTFQVEPANKQLVLHFKDFTMPVRCSYRVESDVLQLSFDSVEGKTIADVPDLLHLRNHLRTTNSLKQVGIALYNYDQTHGSLPQAALTNPNAKDGKPLLSWRVAILPYIEQEKLYNQFKLDEPWDSEHNKKLIDKMPPMFAPSVSAASNGLTQYQVFIGPGTMFEPRPGSTQGIRLKDVLDGTANTLLVVEAAEPVIWTKPDELRFDPKQPLPKLGSPELGIRAVMADTSVVTIAPHASAETLRALITRNGGETVEMPTLKIDLTTTSTLRLTCSRNRFVPLFNGKDLAGWKVVQHMPGDDPNRAFEVQGGVLFVKGTPSGYLQSNVDLPAPFELRYQWRDPDAGRNPKHRLRFHEVNAPVPFPNGVEVALSPDEATIILPTKTGETRTIKSARPRDDWQDVAITYDGSFVRVRVNGLSIVEARYEGFGPMRAVIESVNSDQSHFRKIEFKQLSPVPLTPEQQQRADLDKLNGEWTVALGKIDGNPIPAKSGPEMQLRFKDHKSYAEFELRRTDGTVSRGTFQIDAAKKELLLELEGERNPVRCSYRFEGDRLVLDFPKPRDFKFGNTEPFVPDYRTTSINNLRKIGLAMHIHHDANSALPQAAIKDVKNKDGKPLLSWRVALLPFLDQDQLYRQFKLEEPWDSEHNKKLIPKMPKIYAPPGLDHKEPGLTQYQVFVGPGTAFEPRQGPQGFRFGADFPDGLSNTILVTESREPVIWTKPDDLPFDPKKPVAKLGWFQVGPHVCMGDGSVKRLSHDAPDDATKVFITRNDGLTPQEEFLKQEPHYGPALALELQRRGGAPPLTLNTALDREDFAKLKGKWAVRAAELEAKPFELQPSDLLEFTFGDGDIEVRTPGRLTSEKGTFRIDAAQKEILLSFEGYPVPIRCSYRFEGGRLRLTMPIRGKTMHWTAANNLKQLALGMQLYSDRNDGFPRAAIEKDGKPLLSWRVAILPYIEEDKLYRQFKLDEPWDSEHNKKLIDKMPKIYMTPGNSVKEPGLTNYRVFVGPGTVFEPLAGRKQGIRANEIPDGIGKTLLIAEAADAVVWTKPDELPFDPKKPLPKLGVTGVGIGVALCDNSVITLPPDVNEKALRALITRDGDERLPIPVFVSPPTKDPPLTLELDRVATAATLSDKQRLLGQWVLVLVDADGKPLPPEKIVKMELLFRANNEVELGFTDVKIPPARGTYEVDPAKKEIRIRFPSAKNPDDVWQFRFEGDRLIVEPKGGLPPGAELVPKATRLHFDRAPTVPEAGWESLFNGKDLANWTAAPPGKWKVENNILIGSGESGNHLTTQREFRNVHIRAELKVNAKGRASLGFGKEFVVAHARIGNDGRQTGTLVFKRAESETSVPYEKELAGPEDWVVVEMIVRPKQVIVKVNGTQTAELTSDAVPENGVIFLESYKDTVLQCRKIEIKELTPKPFVIPARGEKAERKFATFAELVAAADEQEDQVEVRGLPADPNDAAVKQLRSELLELTRKHAGKREAILAARLMSQLAWPLDNLKRDAITPAQFAAIGFKEPVKCPAEIVAVVGKDWGNSWTPVVAFSPDGRWLVYPALKVGTAVPKDVVVWDVEKSAVKHTLTGHLWDITGAVFSADGKWLATSSKDKTVKLWDIETGGEGPTLDGPDTELYSIAFSPDGKWVAAGGRQLGDGSTLKVFLWDVEKRKLEKKLDTPDGYFVSSVAFSPDGKSLVGLSTATGSVGQLGNAAIRFWEVPSGKVIDTLAIKYTGEARTALRTLAFSPDGKTLAAPEKMPTVKLWDTSPIREQRTLSTTDDQVLFGLSFSPNGDTLAASGRDHIALWNPRTGVKGEKIALTRGGAVAFAPDGRHLAVCRDDGVVVILRLKVSAPEAKKPEPPAKKEPDLAAIQPLRDAVAAKGRTVADVKLRVEAGTVSKLDLLAAEVEWREANIKLAEAEANEPILIRHLRELVNLREEERDLIAERVKAGVERPDANNQAEARLADAKARLARVKPPEVAPAPRLVPKLLRKFDPTKDEAITLGQQDKNGWLFWVKNAREERTLRLYEIANPQLDAGGILAFRAKVSTYTARAYPVIVCRYPDGTETRSAVPRVVAEGLTNEVVYEVRCPLKPGAKPDVIRLNLMLQGEEGGRAFFKEMELWHLPTEQLHGRLTAPTTLPRKFVPARDDSATLANPQDANGWYFFVKPGQETVRLFEVENPTTDEAATLVLRGRFNTLAVNGAYLQIICCFPDGTEAVSNVPEIIAEGDTNPTSYEVRYPLKKGQTPYLVRLNLILKKSDKDQRVYLKELELSQVAPNPKK